MDKVKISTANLVILVAGAVMLIASFLAFYKVSGSSKSFNAWSTGNFLIATIPALLGVVMAAEVALEAFAPNVSLPDRVLGFSWAQIHLILALQATIMMLAFLIRSIPSVDKGIGLFLMLVAAVALLVGAVLRMREHPGTRPFG